MEGLPLTEDLPYGKRRKKPAMPVVQKDSAIELLTPGKGNFSFGVGSGRTLAEQQKRQLDNLQIAINSPDVNVIQSSSTESSECDNDKTNISSHDSDQSPVISKVDRQKDRKAKDQELAEKEKEQEKVEQENNQEKVEQENDQEKIEQENNQEKIEQENNQEKVEQENNQEKVEQENDQEKVEQENDQKKIEQENNQEKVEQENDQEKVEQENDQKKIEQENNQEKVEQENDQEKVEQENDQKKIEQENNQEKVEQENDQEEVEKDVTQEKEIVQEEEEETLYEEVQQDDSFSYAATLTEELRNPIVQDLLQLKMNTEEGIFEFDMSKEDDIKVGHYVAVAYESEWFAGLVTEKLDDTFKINFLKKISTGNDFKWPAKEDTSCVRKEFIFETNVELTTKRLLWQDIKQYKEIQDKFLSFFLLIDVHTFY